MTSWNSTDLIKPPFNVERQVREFAQLPVSANTVTGSAVLTFAAGTPVSNAGIANGMSVFTTGFGGNGVAGFFSANTVVVGVTGNTVTVNVAATANVIIGTVVEFDKGLVYKGNTQANTYNADTIMVTPKRLANANVNVSHTHTGWVHVQRKVNNDGTVRYMEETLVALANATATSTASGNTSTTQIYKGL